MLNSIYSTVSGIDFEVIVINNSFRDRGMRALAAKFPDIRLVTNRLNQGFAKANNMCWLANKTSKTATAILIIFICTPLSLRPDAHQDNRNRL